MFTNQHHQCHLLRPEHYTAEDHYRAELESLFQPAWHPIAVLAQVANPGDFITFDLFGHPILLRNMDGELCAFLNVCPHRHARLTNREKGHSSTLRCQYHGWEYTRDGRTGKIPDAQSFRPWDRENSCLRKFRVESWGEAVFVCLADEGPSLREFLSPMPELWGRAFETPYRFACTWYEDFACNWKVVLENSLESYHIPQVHPKTFKDYPQEQICSHELDPRYTTFRTELPDDSVTRRMNKLVRYFGQPVSNTYEHHNIHPHITLAGTDVNRLIHCVYPTGPRSCRYYGFLFSLWGEKRGPIRWLVARFLQEIVVRTAKKVFREDASIFGAVQNGLETSPFPGVIGVREERIHVFQDYVLRQTHSPIPPDPATAWRRPLVCVAE